MSKHSVLDPGGKRPSLDNRCALGIMTKAPLAGKVKTRLTPPLMPEEAAALNICFLRDISQAITQACNETLAQGVGIYTPVGAEAAYENILPQEFFLIPQRDGTFGERLTSAAEDLFSVGFESVCLINSDSPTLLASTFAEAANELGRAGDRVVLGPAEDGGYYLIGVKKLHKRLFEEIDWSTEQVFDQTLNRAKEIGVTVHQLPCGFDVDDRATLHELCDELLGSQAKSTIEIAPNTRRFLSEIVEREGRHRIWPEAK